MDSLQSRTVYQRPEKLTAIRSLKSVDGLTPDEYGELKVSCIGQERAMSLLTEQMDLPIR